MVPAAQPSPAESSTSCVHSTSLTAAVHPLGAHYSLARALWPSEALHFDFPRPCAVPAVVVSDLPTCPSGPNGPIHAAQGDSTMPRVPPVTCIPVPRLLLLWPTRLFLPHFSLHLVLFPHPADSAWPLLCWGRANSIATPRWLFLLFLLQLVLWLWGHIQSFSGIRSRSGHRDRSWQGWGTLCSSRDHT